jgi:glycosyltransferase involved in cell wall biosynthesis
MADGQDVERLDPGGQSGQERPEVSLIIPCLNEDQNIAALVDKLVRLTRESKVTAEILIVDDCSDDYTFREAFLLSNRYENVLALHKGLPRGVGHAFRFGLEHARGRVGALVMGDGVDPLAAIPDFRDKVLGEGYDLVLVNRYAAPDGKRTIPLWPYRVYQWIYRHLCRLGTGLPFDDPTYAFRGFSVDFVRGLQLEAGGFEISPEITLKSWLRGGRIAELPGTMGRRVRGESNFIFSRQAYGFATVVVKAVVAHRAGTWESARRSQGVIASPTSSQEPSATRAKDRSSA